jgi:hypothetical protein
MYLQNKYTNCYNNIIQNAKSRILSKEIYTERHHIIPKSLGGDDSLSNLVDLTAREHFICHLLLPKMLTGIDKRNMTFAIWAMINRDHSKQRSRHKINSHTYHRLKNQVAEATSQLHKGKTVSKETREKLSKSCKGRPSSFKGKTHSDESKKKLSNARKGKTLSSETVAKILESRKGYQHSKETKQKISKGNLGKTVVIAESTKQKISAALKGRSNTWLKAKPAHNKGVPMSDQAKKNMSLGHQNREKIHCPHCSKSVAKCSYVQHHGDKCKKKISHL